LEQKKKNDLVERGSRKTIRLSAIRRAGDKDDTAMQRIGYTLASEEEKHRLLLMDWSIPERQVETSVVLASQTWYKTKSDAQADS